MESDLPWIPGAIREALLEDAEFVSACGGASRIATTRAPSDVTKPFALTRLVVNSVTTLGGGGYRAWVQIDGFCPAGGFSGEEAEPIVWRIATRGKRALEQVRNRAYQTMHFSCHPRAVGALDPDDSRGDDTPLSRAAAQIEVVIHNI
ncbi:MAG: hypothetical protein K0Q93_2724 [Nocardioidaceae bacterium]|nr:hypothetical protein [Nocardioidaceae bacterium]